MGILSVLLPSRSGAGSSSCSARTIALERISEESRSNLDSDQEDVSLDAEDDGHRRRWRRKMLGYRSLPFWHCPHALCHARPCSKRAFLCRALRRPFLAFILFLGFWRFLSLAWATLVYVFPDDLDSRLDAWRIPGGRYSSFSHWSTHGVDPVGCHSHNDYWRTVPLHSAIDAGCIGVEADVFLSNNELLVGHTLYTLHHDHTLQNLYLHPLLDLLQKHNTRSSRLQPPQDGSNLAGVFANDPSQTLVLLIDFKTQGESLWPHVVSQLEGLRDAGYLTHFNGTAVVQRPVTVVVTGNAPFHLLVANSTYRDIFFDAPLDQLERAHRSPDENTLSALSEPPEEKFPIADYNAENSYYASVDFRKTIGPLWRNRFSQGQLMLLRAQVRAAHERGLKVRYWGTPGWPRGIRNHVWHVLVREGVDLINVDDLRDATMQDWRKHRSWFS